MKKGCLNCGKDLSHLNAGAKFCEQKCRNQYNYKRKNKNFVLGAAIKTDEGLKGVVLSDPETTQETVEVPKFIFEKADVPVLRNTIWINTENTEPEETEQENTEQESIDKTPPPVFLEKVTEKENPEHEKYSLLLQSNEQRQDKILKQIKILEASLKEQEGRNGNDLVTIGLIAGGTLGLIFKSDETEEPEPDDMILSDKKGKKLGIFSKKGKRKRTFQREEETPWFIHLRNIIIGGAIGSGIGYLGKLATEKQREEDKKQKIALIKSNLDTLRNELDLNQTLIKSYRDALNKQPKLLKSVERKPNPDYEQFLQSQKNKGYNDPILGFS
ncbi:MAG: hypothetical protein ACXVNP_13620, partial [Bacteroidia bacterium]